MGGQRITGIVSFLSSSVPTFLRLSPVASFWREPTFIRRHSHSDGGPVLLVVLLLILLKLLKLSKVIVFLQTIDYYFFKQEFFVGAEGLGVLLDYRPYA